MTSTQFEKLSDGIEQHFRILDVVAGTMTAEAYRAVDVVSNQNITLWLARGPVVESEIERCSVRLARLSGVKGVQPILRAGVDSRGVVFAVLPEYDVKRTDSRAKTRAELEARFDACVGIVETLHERSVVCGDLCLDSFVVNDRGKVTLLAVLGDLRLASEDHEFNRSRYLAFRPSEQKQGGEQKPSCDLYALGWIADGLFACEVAEERQDQGPPTWLKNVLNVTATEELRSKVDSAASLRSVMKIDSTSSAASASDDFAPIQLPVEREDQREGNDEKDSVDTITPSHEDSDSEEPLRKKGAGGFNGGRTGNTSHGFGGVGSRVAALSLLSDRVVLLVIANFMALGVLLFAFVDSRSVSAREGGADGVMVDPVAAMLDSLRKLYKSDAPAGHQELIQMLNANQAPEVRREIVHSLVFRSRRLGLARVADVVRGNYNASSNPQTFGFQDSSALTIRLLDPTLSQSSRVEDLTKLYDVDPRLATVLAAALGLDSGDAEPYRGILARAVADQVGVPNGGEHSPYALMLLLPDVHDLFSEDLVEVSDKIPSVDIQWLLQELGRKGRSEIATVAQLASNRQIVSGAHAVFLRELQRSAALSEGLRMSLVLGTLGQLSGADIKRFGDWYGQAAPRVLEASIVSAKDSGVRRAAFEALRAKPQADAYVAKLMEFLDSSYGGDSSKYGGVVAVLALQGVVDEQTKIRELDVIQGAPRQREFLKRVVKGAPPEILVIILKRYSDSMDPLDIVDLLSNPSVEVRKTAVVRLSRVNDIMLMKLIAQNYDDETDPSVRELYETQIEVVRDRGKSAL